MGRADADSTWVGEGSSCSCFIALASSITVGLEEGLGDRRPGALEGGDQEGLDSTGVPEVTVGDAAGEGFAIPGSALLVAA